MKTRLAEPAKREARRTHVFYEILETQGVAMIVALWGATKEHGPEIDR